MRCVKRWSGTLNTHPQFGTATVTPVDVNLPKVDFVTARRETYQGAGDVTYSSTWDNHGRSAKTGLFDERLGDALRYKCFW